MAQPYDGSGAFCSSNSPAKPGRLQLASACEGRADPSLLLWRRRVRLLQNVDAPAHRAEIERRRTRPWSSSPQARQRTGISGLSDGVAPRCRRGSEVDVYQDWARSRPAEAGLPS